MVDVPAPVSRDHEFLNAVCGLLAEQTALLGEIRDRLTAPEPEPPAEPEPALAGPVAVELREPDPPAKVPQVEPAPESTPVDDKKPTRTARGGRRATKAST